MTSAFTPESASTTVSLCPATAAYSQAATASPAMHAVSVCLSVLLALRSCIVSKWVISLSSLDSRQQETHH